MTKWPEKLDATIGNPPYNLQQRGRLRIEPIYHKIIQRGIDTSYRTMLITPARFLFNAGATPDKWNKERLNDPHFKVIEFYPDALDVFNNVSISGGVAVTYHDATQCFNAIGKMFACSTLKNIYEKVTRNSDAFLSSGFYNTEYFKLKTGDSSLRLKTNVFSKLPHEFKNEPFEGCSSILGRFNGKRVFRYVDKRRLSDSELLDKFSVIVPCAYSANMFFEKSTKTSRVIGPLAIKLPNQVTTQTFTNFGPFDRLEDAERCLKYLTTRFARTCIMFNKVSQNIKTAKIWQDVPMQDFTENSDVPWDKSLDEIDEYFFDYYGLTEDERAAIHANIRHW